MISAFSDNSLKTVYKHALVWAIFIAYEISYVRLSGVPKGNFFDYALHYLANIVLFYCNFYGLRKIFRLKSYKTILITVFILIEILAYLVSQILISQVLHFFGVVTRSVSFKSMSFIVNHVYRAVYFIGFSIAYWFAVAVTEQKKVIVQLENDTLRREKEQVELENSLMHAKNAYLQSQLNPHLLFNTLNFIYNSVRKISTPAANAILLLSEMMRYSLIEVNVDGKVELESEINHIKNLIELNQLRFSDRLNVKTHFEGPFKEEHIIPLALIPFVENIFKHADLTNAERPAQIEIICKDHVLHMQSSNLKNRIKAKEGWGIGVENSRKRLSSFYKEHFSISITEDEENYSVELILDLK